MTIGIIVFLAGLYVAPLVLLYWGHHIRRRSPRLQRAFWGAISGHCIAGALALIAGLTAPEDWEQHDRLRGFFGLWALTIFPLAGGIAGVLSRAPRP